VERWPLLRTPASAGDARAVARSFLASCPGAVDEEAVLLVVTELVSNAVQHGEDPIELRLDMTAGVVHVEVADGGASRPIVGSPSALEATGRGLAIVAGLGRWGFTPVEQHGKRVWCDIGASPSPRA